MGRTTRLEAEYQDILIICTNCGDMQPELIKHIVLECKESNPTPLEGESGLGEALRFAGEDVLKELTRITRTK